MQFGHNWQIDRMHFTRSFAKTNLLSNCSCFISTVLPKCLFSCVQSTKILPGRNFYLGNGQQITEFVKPWQRIQNHRLVSSPLLLFWKQMPYCSQSLKPGLCILNFNQTILNDINTSKWLYKQIFSLPQHSLLYFFIWSSSNIWYH